MTDQLTVYNARRFQVSDIDHQQGMIELSTPNGTRLSLWGLTPAQSTALIKAFGVAEASMVRLLTPESECGRYVDMQGNTSWCTLGDQCSCKETANV